jgi:hypothetical protein
MRYKCVSVNQYEHWLTIGKVYEGDIAINPPEFAQGKYIEIKRADDGFRAYVLSNQFVPYDDGLKPLGV